MKRVSSVVEKLVAEVKATKPRRLLAFVVDKTIRLAGPLVSSKLRIFRYDLAAPRPPWPKDFTLIRFSPAMDVPAELAAEVSALGLQDQFVENFAQGADLWLGLMNGKLAVSLWTIKREKLPQWHVQIKANDVVLYSVVTQPSFRGQGLTGAAAAEIWQRIGDADSRFYVDCKIWNRSAQQAFTKAGFKYVLTAPPHG